MPARPIIGLVGQVCAGKSAVAEAFRKRGALVYDADEVVHGLYEREDVKQEVRALCGPAVFDSAGRVDRKALGARVFANPAELKRLTEETLFPRTGQVFAALRDAFRANADPAAPRALILDAPTLCEAGRADWCDRIVFVSAPRERREGWARERRGWAAGELDLREARLLPEAEKRALCQGEIANDGSLERLDRQVGQFWRKWVEQK